MQVSSPLYCIYHEPWSCTSEQWENLDEQQTNDDRFPHWQSFPHTFSHLCKPSPKYVQRQPVSTIRVPPVPNKTTLHQGWTRLCKEELLCLILLRNNAEPTTDKSTELYGQYVSTFKSSTVTLHDEKLTVKYYQSTVNYEQSTMKYEQTKQKTDRNRDGNLNKETSTNIPNFITPKISLT